MVVAALENRGAEGWSVGPLRITGLFRIFKPLSLCSSYSLPLWAPPGPSFRFE